MEMYGSSEARYTYYYYQTPLVLRHLFSTDVFLRTETCRTATEILPCGFLPHDGTAPISEMNFWVAIKLWNCGLAEDVLILCLTLHALSQYYRFYRNVR